MSANNKLRLVSVAVLGAGLAVSGASFANHHGLPMDMGQNEILLFNGNSPFVQDHQVKGKILSGVVAP